MKITDCKKTRYSKSSAVSNTLTSYIRIFETKMFSLQLYLLRFCNIWQFMSINFTLTFKIKYLYIKTRIKRIFAATWDTCALKILPQIRSDCRIHPFSHTFHTGFAFAKCSENRYRCQNMQFKLLPYASRISPGCRAAKLKS